MIGFVVARERGVAKRQGTGAGFTRDLRRVESRLVRRFDAALGSGEARLTERIAAAQAATETRLTERIDAAQAATEARLADRIDATEARFDRKLDEAKSELRSEIRSVDRKLDEARSQSQVQFEALRDDIQMLASHMVRMESKLDRHMAQSALEHAQIRAEMLAGDAALDRRIRALEERA